MPALEWVLTKFGQEPPNKGAWNFTSNDWIIKMQTDGELTINATNLTVQSLPSSYASNRRRRLLQHDGYSNVNVYGKVNYFEPRRDKYIEVIVAPESLKLLLDVFLGKGVQWWDEDYFIEKRSTNETINVTRTLYIPELKANDLNVDGNCRVEGQMDTVGQTNSYGNIDFYPGDMYGGMFSFGKGLKGSLRPAKPHHIRVHDGELEMDGQMCGCSSR